MEECTVCSKNLFTFFSPKNTFMCYFCTSIWHCYLPIVFFSLLFFYRLLTVYALFLSIAFSFRFTSFLMPFLLLSFHNVTFSISYIILFFCYLYTYLWVSYSIWMHIFFTSTSNITLIFFFLFSTHKTIFYTYFLTYCFHY